VKKIPFYLLFFVLISTVLSAENALDIINLENVATQSEDFTIWSALFGLGAVALIALFLSSEQLENFKKSVKKREETQKKINQAQDQILSNMSENIQNIAQETVSTAKKIVDADETKDINNDLEKVVNSETELLAITVNLIEFLRLKSKKIKIVNEKFRLSNLLNDVTGMLKENTKNLTLELIYDVKSNIPENLQGDTLNLSKVLANILLFFVENRASEVIVEISKSKKDELQFIIKSDLKIDVEDSENIFNSNYDEERNTYDSLGLFIAKELTSLMGGELVAKNDKNSFAEFVFNIPTKFEKEEKELGFLDTKKILIVDSSDNSARVIKAMFLELKHKAKVISTEDFLSKPPKFDDFDIALIDEKLFTNNIIQALKQSNVKIVSLSKLFKKAVKFENTVLSDSILNKPITREQLLLSIRELYLLKPKSKKMDDKQKKNENTLVIHRNSFENTPNIDISAFAAFRESSVLLVEDNLINQKVFLGILNKSGMTIHIANDGQEALDILNDTDKKVDIIFMDINMPIMDGYIATTKIRLDERFKLVPVIALSALTSVSEVDKMFACGMNGYLAKPLRKGKLFSVFSLFITDKSPDRRSKVREEKKIISLDGLNIERGIYQSNSNEIFYKEILSEFKDAYSKSDEIFENLINDFRYEQLRMLCVDINGLSGAIGAEDMHELTTTILQTIAYKKHELLPTFVQEYSRELHKINTSIEKYLS
jgi:CheY-like chemotaxis protein/signal transduction histidine kinase